MITYGKKAYKKEDVRAQMDSEETKITDSDHIDYWIKFQNNCVMGEMRQGWAQYSCCGERVVLNWHGTHKNNYSIFSVSPYMKMCISSWQAASSGQEGIKNNHLGQ